MEEKNSWRSRGRMGKMMGRIREGGSEVGWREGGQRRNIEVMNSKDKQLPHLLLLLVMNLIWSGGLMV